MPIGKRQIVLQGVQEDVVAQDVALDRLQEDLAAAFQPLEQVGAAEAHQALAAARQVLQRAPFLLASAVPSGGPARSCPAHSAAGKDR